MLRSIFDPENKFYFAKYWKFRLNHRIGFHKIFYKIRPMKQFEAHFKAYFPFFQHLVQLIWIQNIYAVCPNKFWYRGKLNFSFLDTSKSKLYPTHVQRNQEETLNIVSNSRWHILNPNFFSEKEAFCMLIKV